MSDTTITAHPLAWPIGWERTPAGERQRAAFSRQRVRPFGAVRDELLNELRLLGATDVVLSTNIPLRKDGLPYATFRTPEDPGIAVYFDLRGEQKCFPSDKWDRIEDNVRAVSLTINALRGLDRWGSKHMLDAVFAGFAALPDGGGDISTAWWTVLGVSPDAWLSEIDAAYKRKVKTAHPDAGGDPEAFLTLQEAHRQAREARAT